MAACFRPLASIKRYNLLASLVVANLSGIDILLVVLLG